MAEQYAQRMLARGGHELQCSQMHALLGRGAARRGDRVGALAQWREAAATAMDGRWHLYALQVGWQCGGEEGRAIADAACLAMGRPQREILQELQEAGAVLEGGDAATAWAVAWGKGTAGNAQAHGTASPASPRRKLEEAKALDGPCGWCVTRGVCMWPGGGGRRVLGVQGHRRA